MGERYENHNTWQPDYQDPVTGRRTVYRPGRGMVPQMGRPPQVDASGRTQAQINGETYLNPNAVQWDAQFPKLPNGQQRNNAPAPAAPTLGAPTQHDIDPGMTRAPHNPGPAAMPQIAAQPASLNPAPPQPATPAILPNAGGLIENKYGTASVQRAAPVAPDWQGQIMAAHPNIGVAGSPENLAFVSAFNQHGAPERGMSTAAEVMRGFQPKPNIAARGPEMRDTPELTPGIRNEARRVDPYASN